MKAPNSLEESMQSWTLRRPSRQIEEELFGGESRESRAESHRRRLHLPWYQTLGASLAACVVLLLTVANFTHIAATGSGGVSFGLSNHSYAASLAMASAPHNSLSAPILGWTNERAAVSTIRSFDLLNTNLLR
jgi:hypothetical protein